MADILSDLEALANQRRPDDALLGSLLPRYYSELPDDDADGRRRDDLYAACAAHLRLGRRRQPGETLVEVLSPELERDGWQSTGSILLFITDDIPFLVDTVRLVLDRHDLGIHLLVHPTLAVERDGDGALTSIGSEPGPTTVTEAWTQIEIDRCGADLRAVVEREVMNAIAEVHLVVDDFADMQSRLLSVADGDALLTLVGDGPPRAAGVGDLPTDRRRRAGARAGIGPRATPSPCAPRRQHGRPAEPPGRPDDRARTDR